MSDMGTMAHENWPWLALILLGAYHGLNPAMGWLFAVALGLQEGRREAVLKAFWPIALGHMAAVALVVAAVLALQVAVPLDVLRYLAAGVLIAFGLYKLIRRKHPRWVGMRVGFKDLTLWSFIMASAHGAGLMLVPVLLKLSGTLHEMEHRAHEAHEHWGHGMHLFFTSPETLAGIGNGGGGAGSLRQAGFDDPQAHLVQRGPHLGGGTGWGGCDHAARLKRFSVSFCRWCASDFVYSMSRMLPMRVS
jgi:hypothetical protein